VFGRRAALAALDQPEREPRSQPPPPAALEPPSEATRAALWRGAGLERDAAGLRALLDDDHPLARLIAASALAREESRGAHYRTDFPNTDPALDHRHGIVRGDAPAAYERWD
jgi:L-aspartate oxidase